MKKNILSIAALSLLCMGFASCSDDELPYSEAQVTNTELRTILEKQGIQFDETGHMLLDDKVQNLTKLDLTGTKFTDFKALTILPSLNELDLSDNEFGPTFDFSTLPAQITGVDLTGNEIYDYSNLVKVETAENGEETVTILRDLKKLHLPNEAEENMTDIMYYYRENKTSVDAGEIDMKMQDAQGNLAAYTSLRSVPDSELREFMKTNFSDIFTGDKIDITKHINEKQNTIAFTIGNRNSFAVKNPTSLEGIQYVMNSPYYKATMFVVRLPKPLDLPKIKFPETMSTITLENLNVQEEMVIDNGTIITLIQMNGLKKIDFSNSKIFGQRGAESEGQNMLGSYLQTYDCPDLEEIKFPEVKDLKANKIDVEYMPKLKELSMKNFNMVVNIQIGDLNDKCKLEYPNLTEFFYDALWEMTMPTTFSVSEKTYNRPETKNFVDKFYTNATENALMLMSRMNCDKNDPYYWE